MSPATHSGSCQVCGRAQKLPGQRLSKHGYTTQWGFFSGVCTGADGQPFELSKDLIDAAIKNAQQQRAAQELLIVELETAAIGDTAPFHVYVSGNFYRKSGYEEQTVTLFTKQVPVRLGSDEMRDELWFRFADGKEEPCFRYAASGRTREEIIGKLRAGRIGRIRKVIENIGGYISWQQFRIKDWVPHPEKLVPVKGKAKSKGGGK